MIYGRGVCNALVIRVPERQQTAGVRMLQSAVRGVVHDSINGLHGCICHITNRRVSDQLPQFSDK